MSKNRQWDIVNLDNLNVPYNINLNELSTSRRLAEGSENTLVTFGGALTSRPRLIESNFTALSGRMISRLWHYERILPLSNGSYGSCFLASVRDSDNFFHLKYIKNTLTPLPWADVPNLGDINKSVKQHEINVVRGKAYVKSFPHEFSTTDRMGMFTFEINDVGDAETNYWGCLAPTKPAQLAEVGGARAYGPISGTATSIIVTNKNIGNLLLHVTPVPFFAQIDNEEVKVTYVAWATPSAPFNTLTVERGVNGTVSTAHEDGSLILYRNWTQSVHNVGAAYGWKYSYCWKNKNGQYSNRAPLETNLDNTPSITGPVTRKIPKIKITCPTDIVNYPSILILRTTDGGGTFFPLTEINNPGTPETIFEDKYYPSGEVASINNVLYTGPKISDVAGVQFADPVEDQYLKGDSKGPGLNTNSFLPTVNLPKEIAIDAPETKTTSLVYWKNRQWLGIGNTLYYTSNEELPYGIPEESHYSALNDGNSFRFQDSLIQIFATKDYLLVFTKRGRILKITGQSKETFLVDQVYDGVGFLNNSPDAICKAEDKVFFVSKDYHLYMMGDDGSSRIISHPLKDTIKDAVLLDMVVEVEYYTDTKNKWIILGLMDRFNGGVNSKIYVYDLYKSHQLVRSYADNVERETMDLPEKTFDFWNSPWTIQATTMITAPYLEETEATLWFAMLDGTVKRFPKVELDFTLQWGSSDSGWDFRAIFGQMENPNGNHLNTLRQPGVNPNQYATYVERLVKEGDSDPQLFVHIDDLWRNPLPVKTHKNQFLDPEGFKISYGTINNIGKYFSLKIEKNNVIIPINIQKAGIIFEPEGGV